MARENPFRFSTKYTDEAPELLYFGYRYYSPAMGRWFSRDPIGQIGGKNFNNYLNNDIVNTVDFLGLTTVYDWLDMFLHYQLGHGDAMISDSMQMEAQSSASIQRVLRNLDKKLAEDGKCGSANTSTYRDIGLDYTQPFSDPKGLQGEWQMPAQASCSWKCGKINNNCICSCTAQCNVKLSVSKLYTLAVINQHNSYNSHHMVWYAIALYLHHNNDPSFTIRGKDWTESYATTYSVKEYE